MFRSFLLSLALLSLASTVQAQDAVMKSCGDKWQAAKAAGTTNGTTWPKFLADCRASSASAPASTPTSATPKRSEPAASPAKPAGDPVLPAKVDPKFADLRPAQARQKTCSAQFQANKATGGNAGLKWIQKGGGYWSLCNKRLKPA